MKRLSILLYALFAYLAGLATLVYLLLWIYPWSFLPVTVDSAPLLPLAHSPFAAAALDLGLIALFGLQHSLMVRPGIKRRLDRLPRGTRRATYTLASTWRCCFCCYFGSLCRSNFGLLPPPLSRGSSRWGSICWAGASP